MKAASHTGEDASAAHFGAGNGEAVRAPRLGQPRKRVKLNKLALKIALPAAATTAALLVVVRWYAAPLPMAWVVAGSILIGAVVYAVAHHLVDARLALAHATLMQIRKRQFENLDAAHTPRGDELNALIWQVYRTGLTLEKEIQQLKKMENYRREFLGNVSHELKTPIFAVQGFAETLLGGALEDTRVNRSFVEKIARNAVRLSNLTRDLSEISRIETGELKMDMGLFDLQQMAREVVESLEMSAEVKDVSLRYQVPSSLPLVLGDRERIRQVLINLVDNAVKYNNPGGYVEVVARLLPAREVKVSVVDNGIGIAPQDLPRVTERFYRVDKSRSRDQGGTGLGLAIVKHILAAHERTLKIESQPGGGSTFGFTLATAASR